MLTNDLVPCFVQSFKTDSKTGYEKALLVGVFDKTTTDLDCCISSSSRDTGKTRQPVAVVMCKDGRLQEVNVRRVVIDGSDEVFDMYVWMFNENDITEQLGFQRKEDERQRTDSRSYFCKGWENARGCRIEHDAAVAYGLEVLYED